VEVTCGSPICTNIGNRYNFMKKFPDPLSLDKSSSNSLISAVALGVCTTIFVMETEKNLPILANSINFPLPPELDFRVFGLRGPLLEWEGLVTIFRSHIENITLGSWIKAVAQSSTRD
jgi:hypothetical protein